MTYRTRSKSGLLSNTVVLLLLANIRREPSSIILKTETLSKAIHDKKAVRFHAMSVSRVFRLPMLFTLRERVLSAMLRSGGAVRALVCSFAKTRQSVSGAGIESMRGLQRLSCRGTFQPRIGGRSSPKSSARRICNGIARPVNAATPTTFRGKRAFGITTLQSFSRKSYVAIHQLSITSFVFQPRRDER